MIRLFLLEAYERYHLICPTYFKVQIPGSQRVKHPDDGDVFPVCGTPVCPVRVLVFDSDLVIARVHSTRLQYSLNC